MLITHVKIMVSAAMKSEFFNADYTTVRVNNSWLDITYCMYKIFFTNKYINQREYNTFVRPMWINAIRLWARNRTNKPTNKNTKCGFVRLKWVVF